MPKKSALLSKLVFALMIAFQLLSVWGQPYFLTADGPAHVYNSKILLDLFQGEHVNFYLRYYELRSSVFPNWFSHIALAVLQLSFSPFISEKILVSGYIILFAFTFRFTIQQLTGNGSWLSLLTLPFTLHFLVYYGFYNYCFGVSLGVLFVGVWKKYSGDSHVKQLMVLVPLAMLMSITHLFSWFIAGLILGAVFIVDVFLYLKHIGPGKYFKKFIHQWLAVTAVGSVSVLFCFSYMQQNAGEVQYFLEEGDKQWEIISQLKMLVLWNAPFEAELIQIFIGLLLLLAALQIYTRMQKRQALMEHDAWLIVTISLVVIYFSQPRFLCLGGFWSPRISWLPWWSLAAWLASYSYTKWVTAVSSSVTVALIVLLAWIRFPFQQKTSEALSDYLSAVEHIDPESRILPVSFSHHGIDQSGKVISTHRRQFQHAFDYCGALKPVINLANYEGATTWFPLYWKAESNPFASISAGIEWQPPVVNWNTTPNLQPDFVITWCMNFADSTTAEWKSMDRQLRENFKQRYVSASGRTIVWERR